MRCSKSLLFLLALCLWATKLCDGQTSTARLLTRDASGIVGGVLSAVFGVGNDNSDNGGTGGVDNSGSSSEPSSSSSSMILLLSTSNGSLLMASPTPHPASSTFLPTSQTSPFSQNSGEPGVTPRHRISRAKVAGIAAGVAIMLVACFAIGLFFLFKRRRTRHRSTGRSNIESTRAAATISPFILIPQIDSSCSGNTTLDAVSDVRNIGASTIACHHFETQLLRVAPTRKIVDLRDQERLFVRGESHRSGIPSRWRSVAEQTAFTRPSSDVEAQLQSARAQINVLVQWMSALEANSDSTWARVVGDEPPPEYN